MKTITIQIPITDDVKFIHVTTTTDQNVINTPSPPSKLKRYRFEIKDGEVKEL